MTLRKGYLSQKSAFSIPKKRWVISIFFSLVISFTLYAFFCFIRTFAFFIEESFFGYFFIGNGPVTISEEELFWQNFSFALLALVVGYAIFLVFVFTRPLQFNFSNSKRGRIVNDQTFLSFNLYYFFFKILFLSSLLIASELIQIFNQFRFLFYLLALVLFLESYKYILLIFRRSVYKYMIFSGILIIVLSFIFACFDVFNTKKLEAFLLEKNPKIDLPIAEFNTDTLQRFSSFYTSNLHIIKVVKKENEIQYHLDGGDYFSLKELYSKIQKDETEYHFLPQIVAVYAPADMMMSEINKMRMVVYDLYFSRGILFVTLEEGFRMRNPRGILKKDWFTEKKMQQFLLENDMVSQNQSYPLQQQNIEELHLISVQIKGGNYFINGERINKDNLMDTFLKYINDNNGFHLVYEEKNTTYQEFITIYSTYRQALALLRESEQKTYSDTQQNEQDRVKTIYPMRFYENEGFER